MRKAMARIGALLTLGLFLAAPAVEGQARWSVDIRGGAAAPADDLGEAELESGIGFAGSVAVRVHSHLWAYGGWGWTELSAQHEAWGTDADLEQTGYVYGLRWEQPLGDDGPAVFLHAAGTLEHLEVESAGGALITDSDHGPGWEAGVGISVPVWGAWRVTPGVRYRGLSRELTFDDLTPEVYLEYVALEVGFSRSF